MKEKGTVLDPKEAALISDKGKLGLLMPKVSGELAPIIAFIAACAMRYSADPAWVEDLRLWLEKQALGKGPTLQ